MTRSLTTLVCGLVLCAASTTAPGGVTPVGPFTGDFSDTFNRFTNTQATAFLDVFDDMGEIRVEGTGGSIKVEFSSQLGSDLVVPISGMMMGQLAIANWRFDAPAVRFGGWWENNSGADHATLEFFDVNDQPLGSVIANVPAAAQQWTWNGWESDVPFSRIRVTGNGLINGFIWYENMQLDVVPEPSGAVMLGAVLATFVGWRVRRST